VEHHLLRDGSYKNVSLYLVFMHHSLRYIDENALILVDLVQSIRYICGECRKHHNKVVMINTQESKKEC
jgi:hypothetical protein